MCFIHQLSRLYLLDLKSFVHCLEALTEYFVDIPLQMHSTVSIRTGSQRWVKYIVYTYIYICSGY